MRVNDRMQVYLVHWSYYKNPDHVLTIFQEIDLLNEIAIYYFPLINYTM